MKLFIHRLRRLSGTIFVICVICGLSFSQAPNCGCEDKPQINVLAVVNGVKITKKDLSIDTLTNISLAQDTVITARSEELQRQITKLLLEAEAKRRGITQEQLFQVEVVSRVPLPTEAEAKAFYEHNRTRNAKDFKSVKENVMKSLKTQRETLRAAEFTNTLRVVSQIETSEVPVTPPTSEADLSRVYAIVNGVRITSADIEQSLLPLIFRVQQQVYALRKLDLDLRINDLLLEQESKRLGMSPQSLINQNVKVRAPIITTDQARAYYEQNKKSLQGGFNDLKVPIMQLLLAQEERKLFVAYAEQLRKAAALQIYLTPPEPPTLRQLCCNPVD